MGKTMQRYTDYDRELQDAVRQLAAVATASASEKKHDAKMAAIATNAATTVHEVLERSAQRARLYGWITGGVSITVALVAVIVASSITQNARDVKQSYDRALTRVTAESTALHAQLDSSKKRWESMQLSRKEDRSILSSTLDKLTQTYDRLVASTSLIAVTASHNPGHEYDSTTAPKTNSFSRIAQPTPLTSASNIASYHARVKASTARKTRAAVVITTFKSSASRRLVDTMRSQRKEARGQVEELFDVYSNESGSCIRSR